MKIYTTSADGARCEQYAQYDVGCMIPTPCKSNLSNIRKHCQSFAMDNGAFGCYRRGLPFMPDMFEAAMRKVYEAGVVCGGRDSLKFSLEWAYGRLRGVRNLALVVQPGMSVGQAYPDLPPFTWIFIGGGMSFQEIPGWVEFAHNNGKKVHVGKVGTLEKLRVCQRLGVDSCDSSSFMRNQSWHIIEEFRNGTPDL